MKKLVAIVVISVCIMIMLVILAFFYVDLSGHVGCQYEILIDGISSGFVRVDKYITEDKIIYKSIADCGEALDYPAIAEKFFLQKDYSPLKFVKKHIGMKGQQQLTMMVWDEENCNFLFLRQPEFLTYKENNSGSNSMVFNAQDIMLYMPLVQKYNFWKKGTQFFNCVIPIDEAILPVKAKLSIKYLKEEYIPIMGCKTESESYIIRSDILPDIKMFLSKYTHKILAVEITDRNIRFSLIGSFEGPGKRLDTLRMKIVEMFNFEKFKHMLLSKKAVSEEITIVKEQSFPQKKLTGPAVLPEITQKEIFFESGDLLLSGQLWVPVGEKVFSAVIIIPDDGPIKIGEQDMLETFARFFSESGFVVLIFDNPGQGKSQGNFILQDDLKKIRNIEASVKYLGTLSFVKKGSINLIGYGGAGYLSLKAGAGFKEVNSLTVLDLSLRFEKTAFLQEETLKDNVRIMLDTAGFKNVNALILDGIAEKIRVYTNEVIKTSENFSYFLGIKLPLKEYRDFLRRNSYSAVELLDKPLLLAFSRDNNFFDAQGVNDLKKLISDKHAKGLSGKAMVFKNSGYYMGKLIIKNGLWTYEPNKEVFQFIKDWICKEDENKHATIVLDQADDK
ncbi:MAG: alpha/beta hydrolase [Candidatus Omnitrophica bacterium]|nr:alpha/beta hydrolase [Candidatus Omnitrophota bacterium]